MSPATALRLAVLGEWVFGIGSIVSSELLAGSLPRQLQEFRAWQTAQEGGVGEVIWLVVGVAGLASFVVACVALLRLRSWGRWLYLAVTDVMLVLSLSAGPSVSHPIEALFDELATTFSGLVLGIAFFSSLFKGRSVSLPAPDKGWARFFVTPSPRRGAP